MYNNICTTYIKRTFEKRSTNRTRWTSRFEQRLALFFYNLLFFRQYSLGIEEYIPDRLSFFFDTPIVTRGYAANKLRGNYINIYKYKYIYACARVVGCASDDDGIYEKETNLLLLIIQRLVSITTFFFFPFFFFYFIYIYVYIHLFFSINTTRQTRLDLKNFGNGNGNGNRFHTSDSSCHGQCIEHHTHYFSRY